MARRGTLLALVLAFGAALLSVPVAQATPPTIVPLPAQDYTDTTSCGFPVDVHYTTNGETLKIFSNGTLLVTGPLVATFSTAGGKSVTVNIPGPGMITDKYAVGRGVGAGPVLLPNGETTLAYVAGVVDISGPAAFIRGHVLLDICDALAP